MRISRLAILALAATAPLLGGCQSIFGTSHNMKTEQWVPEQREPAEYAQSQMALGRDALEYRQYGLAIIAFRNARLVPGHAAAAYNGLAIAYAQIGRPDLAERYFRQAMAEAPGDKRYSANLAHFYQSVPASAVRPARAEALAAGDGYAPVVATAQQDVRILPGAAARSAIRIEAPAQRMVRVSANEVRIATQSPTGVDPRRRAPLRQAAAATPVRRVNPNYPIRFRIGDGISPVRIGGSTGMSSVKIGLAVK